MKGEIDWEIGCDPNDDPRDLLRFVLFGMFGLSATNEGEVDE